MNFKPWQIVLLIIFAPAIIWLWMVVNAPVTKTASLVDKATNTDKMLANYEWFNESATAFDARVKQIRVQRKMFDDETDKGERQRLRMELSAVQQTCRDLAARYAAKTNEIHVGYLKSKNLPETLSAEQCE